MNIAIDRLLEGLFTIFLNRRTQPFFAYILTSLLFYDLIPLKIHLNKPMSLKGSDLDQSFEYFNATK